MMPPFDLSWPSFLALWTLFGFLAAGLVVWFRQVPARFGMTAVMVGCLLFWWLIVLVEAAALLGLLAYVVFNPDGGPIAMLVALVRATSRHDGTPEPKIGVPPTRTTG